MRLFFLLYLALVVQTTWLANGLAWLGGARLDLPLVVVISSALLGGWRLGAMLGLAAGWFCGVAADYNLGSFMVSRMVVGAVSGAFDRRLSPDNPLLTPFCMAGGTVLAHLMFGLMSPADFAQPWPRLLGAIGLNTLAGCALHPLIARFAFPSLQQDMGQFVQAPHVSRRI